MKIQKQPRKRQPARRVDLSPIKEALKDRRCWACMGLVVSGDDDNHYELDGVDLLVEVELVPSQERLTARLGTVAGGPGRGVWAVPAVGTEVALIVPEGDVEFMPIIVATLSTGNVTADLDETIVIMNNDAGDIAIIPSGDVRLGSKTANEQVIRGNSFQTKYNNLLTLLKTHIHPVSGANTLVSAQLATVDVTNNLSNGELASTVKVD